MTQTKIIAATLAMAVMVPVTAAGHDSPRVNVIRGPGDAPIAAELAALAPAAGPVDGPGDGIIVRPSIEQAKPETAPPAEPAQEPVQLSGRNLWTVDAETGAVSVCFLQETVYVGELEIVCVGRDGVGDDDLTLAE